MSCFTTSFYHFVVQGLAFAIFGTTLAHMELLLRTTTSVIAFVFTALNVGVIGGALGCRFVQNRFDNQFMFAVACLVEALLLASAPYYGNIYGFIVVAGGQGATMGFYSVCKCTRPSGFI